MNEMSAHPENSDQSLYFTFEYCFVHNFNKLNFIRSSRLMTYILVKLQYNFQLLHFKTLSIYRGGASGGIR